MLRFKEYLRELTVSPDYRQRNVFNPFYDMSVKINNEVTNQLKQKNKKWKFKSIYKGNETGLIQLKSSAFGRGGYYFQIVDPDKDVDTKYYFITSKANAIGHFGMKQRKDSTASSNINELLSLYFLAHSDEKAGTESEAKEWWEGTSSKASKLLTQTGSIGVVKGDSSTIDYSLLSALLGKDTTAIRDIQIGWHNAREVEKDLGTRTIKSYHWVPRTKPGKINKSNPSDIILKLSDDTYIGYSNKAKAAGGKDSTPKFNTNIDAFYRKKDDTSQVSLIRSIMDDSWNAAKNSVATKHEKATIALNEISPKVLSADYTEGNLKKEFATLGRAFNDDGLNFFADDFYYPYRNNFITKFAKHLENSDNLSYFLETVSGYTFATGGEPCPYKLLIGSPTGSTIKDVSSDDTLRSILLSDPKNLGNIKGTYDGTKQSFKMTFVVGDKSVTIPITARTRATGGWAGRSLYIETPGVKVT
jgi:hypothetical protein